MGDRNDQSYLDESMTPIMTPRKQEQVQMHTPNSYRPFEPSANKSCHLFIETDSQYERLMGQRSVTEVYGTKTKHIVERLRAQLAEKDLKVKVSTCSDP